MNELKYSKRKRFNKKAVKKINSERTTAKNRLIRNFNKFIRIRDYGLPCISCRQYVKLQAGHYYNAGNYASIRFDEKNVNGQCFDCNFNKEGNKQGYQEGLKRKYGEGVLSYLEIKKNNVSKLGVFELNLLNDFYKKKIKELDERVNG